MAQFQTESEALSDLAARQLATATKTVPQLETISPRWLLRFLDWVPTEAGIYRVNRVVDPDKIALQVGEADGDNLPTTFVNYETNPREITLRTISTILDVRTRVADLYSSPHDQVAQQLRLTIETIKEKQESELINNAEYGLLAQVAPTQRLSTLTGAPTPDDLDALLTKVWKKPDFFLAHPLAIAAFGREATWRGVPPATVSLHGSPFISWRGVPLVPSNKIAIEDGVTKVLLVRTGEDAQGVVGLFQPNLVGEQAPGLSVRFSGIDRQGIASYLISQYSALAVLTDDSLAVLDDVRVDLFHEYK